MRAKSAKAALRNLATMSAPGISFKYKPPVDRNMRTLDRSFFVSKVPLCVVRFPDPKNISIFSKKFKESILRVPRIPHVVKLDQAEGSRRSDGKSLACDNGIVTKGVLLADTISSIDEARTRLSPDAMSFLDETEAEILPYEYKMDYDFWKAEEILRAVLPEQFLDEIPTGFTVVGHIAHLNLRQEFKPFAALIGQVILDKNNKIETVVDKVSSIATQFRTFPMQVIAGRDSDLVVEQKESNCTFRFDFSKVYWNSRLHTEHERLVSQFFQPGQVLCDVFAGVGPFAIPAAKKDVIVLANDLNPESFKYLRENIELNKVSPLVEALNLDGGEFISKSFELLSQWRERTKGKISVPLKLSHHERKRQKKQPVQGIPATRELEIPLHINHFVMNLPDSSISFLDKFIGLYHNLHVQTMPHIHLHCFEKYGIDEEPTMEELHDRVHSRILSSLRTSEKILPKDRLSFHLVRKVSPTKPMFCVSFQLPKEVASANPVYTT
ncbi:hypothetical protein HG536_0E02940 [Torulaspora globosa]|uniref:tRNA (guanine(37)-N1)-methyltransferase n=1 Tax=Torulaspora globosa TaxID=48254 RepID=A0A7G3ZIP7_9SACH|nr:uncharacterized protein HG536_0E02940 [Torulaspora globosa]QLL33383.1 hypothetical protein HG536_0E02940 [Torulaspora globosa]